MNFTERLALPLTIGAVRLRNRVFLAPMSGVTDQPMRELAWRHGAGLVVAEMVPGAELVRGRAESSRRIRKTAVHPHMVQLAGRDPALLAEGARIAEEEGADIIDINMGCPAKKVTGGYCGSALMREPDLAARIVEAVAGAVRVPVTVKMRLGWDDAGLNAPQIARLAESAGAAMITVHGRTRCQFYDGRADWTAIARVKQAVSLPVVANGDVGGAADACALMAASGADAVMVGRGHYGRPWLAGSIASACGAAHDAMPEPACLARYVADHLDAMLSLYGRERGIRHARKHLGWYADRHAPQAPPALRARMMGTIDPSEALALIAGIFGDRAPVAPAREAA
jgi:nifR3 family TIM-barrel protein